ncbi:MAG TPA: TIGR03619 family F420-dependent LLM class oxidoreductase [Microthrixaceae bacterium]|nr:TIGR03619 family F420-dependent LLM class oxidoreductase [Microthrixaceae bacterium]
MKLGLFMNTHGIGASVDNQWTLQPLEAERMRVAEMAVRAESAGFDSLWFSDHVLMAPSPESFHFAADPVDGTRAYPTSPDMIDAMVAMSVCAQATKRVRLATSVWIPSYRHPLHDVRQFSSLDQLSDGRFVLGVGAGWMKEEFEALGVPYSERITRTEEACEIYKRSWSDEVVDHHGDHYSFSGIRMNPKPLQKPRPRMYYGGVTKRGARLAAEHCDGFYPTFTDSRATADRYGDLIAQLPQMLDSAGTRVEDFSLLCVLSARIEEAEDDLGFGKGPVNKVMEDLSALAEQGFSLVVLHLDTRNGDFDEWQRQLDLFGDLIVDPVAEIRATGDWQPA